MKIVLLGPGLMGSQIACEYALGGHEVVVLARRPGVARERIERGFTTAREHGLATPEEAAARERMTIGEEIDGADGARIIVESVVEDLAEKKEALLPVVARNPDAIVASNTSSIPITAIGAAIGPVHDGRRALLESSTADADGRGHSWRGNGRARRRGDDRHTAHAGQATRARRSRRAGFRLEPAPARAPAGGGLAGRERRRLSSDGRRDRAGRVGPALALHRAISNGGLGGAATFERVANLLWPALSTATSLHDLRQWLDESPETTRALRERRDRGLAADMRADLERDSGAGS